MKYCILMSVLQSFQNYITTTTSLQSSTHFQTHLEFIIVFHLYHIQSSSIDSTIVSFPFFDDCNFYYMLSPHPIPFPIFYAM